MDKLHYTIISNLNLQGSLLKVLYLKEIFVNWEYLYVL